MRDVILTKLKEIESGETVRILYAAESGSRAWGFASPDSDYDVRFIYVRKPEDYIRVLPMRDVIEWQLDNTLDINGWDIQKALQLLLKSNPTLFEWANSPIVYQTSPDWESLKSIMDSFFSPKSSAHHYLHLAEGNYRTFLKTETVKQKKYLYVLRPILSCRWIIHTQTPPPMEFNSLVEAELDPKYLPPVKELLESKKVTSELGTIARIDLLNEYIEEQLAELENAVSSFPKDAHHDVSILNGQLQKIVLGKK